MAYLKSRKGQSEGEDNHDLIMTIIVCYKVPEVHVCNGSDGAFLAAKIRNTLYLRILSSWVKKLRGGGMVLRQENGN